MRRIMLIAATALSTALIIQSAPKAQQPAPPAATQAAPGIKRTVLQKMDVPGTDTEIITAIVEVAANFTAGRHTHPGPVTGYVMEGDFYMMFDGQSEKALKVGESLVVPDGAIHNEGTKDKPAKLMAVYVVKKGSPLATPVK